MASATSSHPLAATSPPAYRIRAATPADMPQVQAIHAYYVAHTIITFRYDPTTVAELTDKLQSLAAHSLPFLVAATDADTVLGFTYAGRFRAAMAGYARTAELSLFVHTDYRSHRIGGALLTALIDVLRTGAPQGVAAAAPALAPEGKPWLPIKNLIACMSLDPSGIDGGLGLKKWYERFGFEERGRLRGVGWKAGQEIDTIYLQLQLY